MNDVPPVRPIPPRPNFPRPEGNLPTQGQEKKEISQDEKTQSGRKQPLTDQSKSILFGLLGGFALLGGVALLIVMLII